MRFFGLCLSLMFVACASAPRRSTRDRYGLTGEEDRQCGVYAQSLADEEDRMVTRRMETERWRLGMDQCRAQLVQAREATLSSSLRLGLTAMACLSQRRQMEISTIRRQEDIRRQNGERVERVSPHVAEDAWHQFFDFSTGRLANGGGSGGECGTVEAIDAAECMQAQLEHTDPVPSSCGLAYVAAAIDAWKADVLSHSR